MVAGGRTNDPGTLQSFGWARHAGLRTCCKRYFWHRTARGCSGYAGGRFSSARTRSTAVPTQAGANSFVIRLLEPNFRRDRGRLWDVREPICGDEVVDPQAVGLQRSCDWTGSAADTRHDIRRRLGLMSQKLVARQMWVASARKYRSPARLARCEAAEPPAVPATDQAGDSSRTETR
jgi:hypothetical protein